MTNKAVLIAGYYGFGNTGDEAILSGIIAGFRAEKPDLTLKVVTANPEQTKEIYGVETVLWNDIADLITCVKASDLVILGGGGLFHDYWGVDENTLLTTQHAGLPYFAGIPLLANLLEKPCMIYAVGVGPLLTDSGKRLTKMAFERCQVASVRDPYSMDVLRELDIDLSGERVLLFADPAFNQPLADPEEARQILRDHDIEAATPTLGAALRYWDIGTEPDQWETEVAGALDAWIETKNGQVVFLPFQQESVSVYEDDFAVATRVVSKMSQAEKCTIIEKKLPSELRGAMIAECDALIGMRLHAVMYAMKAAVPVLALSYDPKVRAVMERADLADLVLDPEQWVKANLVQVLERLDDPDLPARMESYTEEMSTLASKNLNLALELLESQEIAPLAEDSFLKDFIVQKVQQQVELEHRLTQAQEERDAHAKQNGQLGDAIARHEQDRQSLQEMINEKDEAIARLSEQIPEKDEVIARLNDQNADQNARISTLSAEAERFQQDLESHLAALNTAQSDIKDLRQSLKERGAQVQAIEVDLTAREGTIAQLEETVVEKDHAIAEKDYSIVEKDRTIVAKDDDLQLRNEMILEKDQAIQQMSAWIGEVKWSRAWKVVQTLWRVRLWIAPHGSTRERLLRSLYGVLRSLRSFFGRTEPTRRKSPTKVVRQGDKRLWRPRGVFAEEYLIEDYSQTILYTEREDLFPDYQPRRSLESRSMRNVGISMIATVWNAIDTLDEWLIEFEKQTRQPDEVVIVDGGSTDGTFETLQAYAQRSAVPFKVLSAPGVNIARGRNLAIEAACNEVIVSADFGSSMDPDYIELIVTPFEDNPEMQVVGGWYESVADGKVIERRAWPTIDQIWPQSFLPSARSMAFTKTAWETVGRQPDWLSLTGDDTLFALELKRLCPYWAFVIEATAEWHAPPSGVAYWQKVRSWSVGDGESTVNSKFYWNSYLRIFFLGLLGGLSVIGSILAAISGVHWAIILLAVFALLGIGVIVMAAQSLYRKPSDVLWETGAEVARVVGYLQGARRRKEVAQRRYQSLQGVIFILSGVPIDDTGGGARGTQIALELLRRQYGVVFVHRFPKVETIDLGLQFGHPNLIHASLDVFDLEALQESHPGLLDNDRLAAIVEFPLPEFLPIMEVIKEHSGVIIYDLLDDWNTSLGGRWYSEEGERGIVALSDELVATEASLAQGLEARSGREVLLLPNAVNKQLFTTKRSYARPVDLPEGDSTILYIGALWGEWMDWDLLVELAKAHPQAAVVMIGDYHGDCPEPPKNIHFLGLKPQAELPAYLAHADVAIIPWKITPITQATSPLKVYEYVAMRVPVIAPDLRPLRDMPGVFTASDSSSFIKKVGEISTIALPEDVLEEFDRNNSWEARLDLLLSKIGSHWGKITGDKGA